MLEITTKIAQGAIIFGLAAATALTGVAVVRQVQETSANRRIARAEEALANMKKGATPRVAA